MSRDNRFKRPSGTETSPRRSVDSGGTSRRELYIDDDTLHRMIESFGPLSYNTFQGNPQDPGPDPIEPTSHDYEEIFDWNRLLDWSARTTRVNPRSVQIPSTPAYVLPQTHIETEASNVAATEAKQESIIEWFDRSVEKELRKRRQSVSPTITTTADPALAPLKAKHALNMSKGTFERLAETSASGVEITARLESDFTTELTDAVEKLVKAETMCTYAEALQAAEEAAQNAPPELVEQAAAAEAKRIQTEVTKVKEAIPGVRPIEVVGYVGITKPIYPKKS